MRRIELEVEHSYKSRFVGKHRFKPTDEVTVLGSARTAHIRLLGDAVAGVHATLEHTSQGWVLSDLGSDNGTWVKKRPIIEQAINGTIHVQIGGHTIKMTPYEINNDLFTTDRVGRVTTHGDQVFHQVILRKCGLVIESNLLEAGQEYKYYHGKTFTVLPSPTQKDIWTVKTIGDVTIQQRLTSSNLMQQTSGEKMGQMVDPSLRAPMGGAALVLMILFALFFFAPQKPVDELVELKPDQNQYTRMIFDAKKFKKSKSEAIKVTKNIKGEGTQQSEAQKMAAAPSSKHAPSPQAAAVVSKIKAAGLGQLIGKISKRAAKSANYIQASGRSPDSVDSGKALGMAGSPTLGKTGAIGGAEGARIGGVATAGKGGGGSDYRGAGGLASGNVGNSSVGVLEEETEVEGGLEREVIARYIKSQLGQIRYCYERQLSASPDLYGKVKVKFTIGAAGEVITQAINATSLKNAMVEGCILRRIAGWQFPKPQGGMHVNVSYPFLFKSTK
jgi:pSer/pThr/pTyr-binding forkhead associated (FHA) protein